ncbi:MAG: N-acyl-D-amino-acid deacylase family protein [Bacillota bacterium]
MDDILIRGGKVIDGTGAPWYRADVALAGGRIRAVARRLETEAKLVIDAGGRAVAPGFIDAHSHSDSAFLINPKAESKIRQGVTTEVIGQCGSSAAPLSERSLQEAKHSLLGEEMEITWRSLGEYLAVLESRGVAVNVVPTVGHGTIREAVVGYDDRPPTDDEMRQMKGLVAESMKAGARALTTGLIYPPGSFARTDEIIELARVAAEHGGIYMSHMRDEGDHLLDSMAEAIEIGEKGGLPVQISHHKAVGPANWGRVKDSLALIDVARARGLDVTADQYPYVATSTGLDSIVPNWAHAGGAAALLERLKDGPTRAKLGAQVTPATERRGGWDKILISSLRAEANRRYQGWTLDAIARDRGLDPWVTTCELIISEGGYVGMVRFAMCEEDVKTVMAHPAVMIGSDGSSLAPYGRLGESQPHPRNYGTFVRVLGKYAREEGVLTLVEAVRKMTGLPAARFGLWDRGLVRPGMAADLVVFDPDTVAERATFANPQQYPAGIDHVIVNGQVAVDPNGHTGALAGQILRRPA